MTKLRDLSCRAIDDAFTERVKGAFGALATGLLTNEGPAGDVENKFRAALAHNEEVHRIACGAIDTIFPE